MKFLSRAALALTLLVPFSTSAQASEDETAQICVVHGIPGDDLGIEGLTNELPVDVYVDGALAVPGLEFGDVEGPIPLPAGSYFIEIFLADTTENPVISGDFAFESGEFVSVVAHFTEDMGLTATKFSNDFSRPGFLQTRFILHHTAAAPEVDIFLERLGFFSGGAFIEDVPNGAQGTVDSLFGFYEFGVNVANTDTTVVGPGKAFVLPKNAYLVYVVGSAEKGSLQLIVKRVYLR